MAPLRKMPWSSKSDEDPLRSRPAWYRLRRPEPTTPSSDQPETDTRPQPSDVAHVPESSDSNANVPENIATPSYQEVEIHVDEDSSQHSRCVSAAPETENKSTTSSHSRPPRGSHSLRNIFSRFRHNRPREQGAGSETAQPLQTPETGGRETTTEYTKSGTRDPASPLARNPPTTEPEATEQQRNVSAQTAESYDSENTSATVYRRPSQRLPAPVLVLQQECFSPAFLTDCPPGTGHLSESLDPFADKTNVEDAITSTARAASKRSSKLSSRLSKRSSHAKERTKEASEISQEQDDQILPAPLSFPNRQSICSSRHGSYTSYSSRTNPLEQSRAARRFNVLAGQHNIENLLDEELPNAEAPKVQQAGTKLDTDRVQPRDRLFRRRIRPVQSNLDIEVSSQPQVSKLRRTKTFANLTRRWNPMTSLRGRSLESIARLGGHSYLVWGTNLIPGPLQLPACFVAMILYLRKYGSNTQGLFKEPGDIRAANRLYDYFASHVSDAEKEEPKIALTLRTISMPQWDGQSGLEQILSVGLTFRVLLMGLPGGLLGSPRLYEVLREIYDASISRPFETTPRVQLIAFAMIALTSEMERSLICATFGLLTYLQQKTDESALPEVPQPGTSLRRVASLQNLDNLARVFGPTLLGDYQPELGSADETEVDRETVYYCVARLLLENWQGVNRQLRDWAAGLKQE